ncbi:MAG: cell division protein FtsK [Rhodospirillaceae bacterium]|nr:cell division protein FtsK [Rhodospirillaceae bacterium]
MLASSKKTKFLPAAMRAKIRRLALQAGGFTLVTFSLFFAFAFASHNHTDPSLNTATASVAQNVMGTIGAIISDLMLQSFGLASLLIIPVFLSWGVRLIREKRIARTWLRIGLLPFTVLAASMTLALLVSAPTELEYAGAGGLCGHILTSPAVLAGLPITEIPVKMIGLTLALCVLTATAYLLAFSRQEWAWALSQLWHGMRWASVSTYHRFSHSRQKIGGSDILNDKVISLKNNPDAVANTTPLLRKSKSPSKPRGLVEKRKLQTKQNKRAIAAKQPCLDLETQSGDFDLPSFNLLRDPGTSSSISKTINDDALEQNARLLEGVLQDFGVRGEIVKVRPGPVVTLYELEPAPGTKSSRVIGLADDIARSMSAISVRIATVPGRNVIGIELPNNSRETVLLRELLAANEYEKTKGRLPMVLGKDIGGATIIADLAKMPHLLIAGTTGSGKSVGLNAMILSLLYRLSPEECRFIMIDPKMLELSVYHDIPHLLAPVVTDPKKAVISLKWAVREMEDRYQAMSKLSVRNIEGYNKRVAEAANKGEILTRKIQTGFDPLTGQAEFEEQELDLNPLPFIVVVVDEMADLMLVAGKDIEASIQRLAQMARAAGIHIIMATQRPSVDVITGTIKANFPTRISFQVTSKIDSRTILGEQGAEQLLGQGDMLYTAPGGMLTRVHGPFVSDEEVEAVADHLRVQAEPHYNETVTEEQDSEIGEFGPRGSEADVLYDKAVALVCQEQKASTSFIQRHLQIGYNRAARIMEQMEKQGVVSSANHVGKREILAGNH